MITWCESESKQTAHMLGNATEDRMSEFGSCGWVDISIYLKIVVLTIVVSLDEENFRNLDS